MSVYWECCVCCQVEVSATGRSLVQRRPTECGMFEFSTDEKRGDPGPLGLSSHEKIHRIKTSNQKT